jgi:hypothetical protein
MSHITYELVAEMTRDNARMGYGSIMTGHRSFSKHVALGSFMQSSFNLGIVQKLVIRSSVVGAKLGLPEMRFRTAGHS